MKEIFVSSKTRKTRSGDKLARPNVNNVNTGDRTLRSFGPIVWNTMLPEKLKSCENLNTFKLKIKSWIPDNCLCVLCKTYVEGVGYVELFE